MLISTLVMAVAVVVNVEQFVEQVVLVIDFVQ
jgi:hypothetical protein